MVDKTSVGDSFFSMRNTRIEATSIARLEVALARWSLAQELGCWIYDEQEKDAQLIERCCGGLPE